MIDFFSNIGLSREASMYVKMFRDVVPWRFAVVLISAESLRGSLREVALDLAYLCGLGLYPVIVLDNLEGAGGNLVRPAQAGKPARSKAGVRIRRLIRSNKHLAEEINEAGGRAASILNDIFGLDAPPAEDPAFDFRLLVEHIDPAPIKTAVRNRQIPVISPVVMDRDGRMRVVSAEKVSKALCMRIEPQKFIIISEQAGIVDTSGKLIRNLILSTDYEGLVSSGRLAEDAREQLEAGVRLLREVPELTLQFASAANLLYELFTVKGQGTYIRTGHEVLSARDYSRLDKDALRGLMEDGFGRKLVDDYFDEKPHRVFYERDYHGLIVVKPLEGDIHYLDKFVIGRKWQGEGMGAPLWRELTKHYSRLIWRASRGNPINRWYMEQAEGFQRTGEWNVYWIGLSASEAGELIERVTGIRRTVV